MKAVRNYLATGASLTDQQALAAYAADLPQSSRAFLKAAVGQWAKAMATAVKSGATPDNVNQVQATLYRFEALQEAIQVETTKGQKAHTWLSPMEVRRLMSLPRLEKPIGRLAEENDFKGVIDVADFNDEDKLRKGKEMVDRLSKLVAIFDGLNLGANRAEGKVAEVG